MKKVFFATVIIATLVTFGMAQDAHTAASITPFIHSQRNISPIVGSHQKSAAPAYCKGKSCLYYAGDFDSANSGANGICLVNNGTNNCQAFVGVKPKTNATITGSSSNVLVFQTTIGTNPTPFGIFTGIKTGVAGKQVCSTGGTTTLIATGRTGFGLPEYTYTVKKFSKGCKVKKGKTYYVSLQPTYTDGASWGFLSDVEDVPAMNHHGWKTLEDATFANYPNGGLNYAPAGGSGGFCAGLGCDAFSVAVTGKATK